MGYARHSQICLLIHLLKGVETPVGQANGTKLACLRAQLSGTFCGVFTDSERGLFQTRVDGREGMLRTRNPLVI